MLGAELLTTVRRRFGRKSDLSQRVSTPAMGVTAQPVDSEQENSDFPRLVPVCAAGSGTPLFCMHSGTGNPLCYTEMALLLGETQPVYALRGAHFTNSQDLLTVEELAQNVVRDIRKFQKHGPYQLCGVSFAGLVAYEVATRLLTLGEEVYFLGLFDTGNPAYYRDMPLMQSLQFKATYFFDRIPKYGRRLLHGELGKIFRDLRKLLVWECEKVLWKLTRKRSQLMPGAKPTAIRDKVIMYTAIARAFTPKAYGGRLHLFRAQGRSKEFGKDMSLGWGGIVQGGVEIHNVPGEHAAILEKPYVASLVEEMKRCMLPSSINRSDSPSRNPE
ncbi:MAG: hypothetical protein NVS9B4_11660 [Candidatus Acidiferrum sp.]